MRIIAGKYKNRLLKSVSKTTRPTSAKLRARIFDLLQTEIQGARFLDLFAGSGAVGFEALSRGALHTTFIEGSRKAARVLRLNGQELQATTEMTLHIATLPNALRKLQGPFDIIFADPPYAKGLGQKILDTLESLSLLAPSGHLLIEEEAPQLISPSFALKSARSAGRASLFHFTHREHTSP